MDRSTGMEFRRVLFRSVVDDEMGIDVRVTVIAAGFDRWDGGDSGRPSAAPVRPIPGDGAIVDVFAEGGDDLDVPSFLK